MKKIIVIALVATLIITASVLPASAAYLSNGNFDILITEVCVNPMQDFDGGFGQLIEIYNNTDGVLDLNDYELMITSGRSTQKQFVEGGQFKGLIKPVSESGKVLLSSGELAVIWLVYNDAQKSATEQTVRDEMKNRGAEIPADTQIIRVDTTDASVFYGEENHLRLDTRYLMVNLRGSFEKNKNLGLDAYAEGDGTGRGAYVRVYGSEDGTSQFFGTPTNSSNEKVLNWQNDGASAKSYDTPNFGKLVKNSNIDQYAQIKGVPGVNYDAPVDTTTPAPVDTTTPAPVDTTTPAPADTTTPAPVDTTTAEPVDTTTAAPADTTTAAPADTTTAPADTTTAGNSNKGGCGSSLVAGGAMTLAFVLAAYAVTKKK